MVLRLEQEPIDGEDPRDLGFFMPGEWHPHQCTWMGWPHRQDYWIGPLEKTQRAYARVANTIAAFEPVHVLVAASGLESARQLLSSEVTIVEMEIDQPWLRDTGPNFLIDGSGGIAGSTWQFNAWGGKYRLFANDALIGERILARVGQKNFTSPIFAEGGGVTVDGEGTVITTEQCFLNKNRNPNFSKDEVEQELLRTLGAEKVIWLKGDPLDDETDGHVDGLAAFTAPGRVIAETYTDIEPEAEAVLLENLEILRNATDARGRSLDVSVIENGNDMEADGDVYCGSYVNSYICNSAVITPTYDIDLDADVRALWQSHFQDREVVGVPIHDIAIGGGGLHCITQQQPKP